MNSVTKKTVEQIAKEKRRRREVSLALAIIFAVLLLAFGIAAINEKVGNFTINMSYLKKDEGISIYDSYDKIARGEGTTRLKAEPVNNLYNITYEDLDKFADIDGPDGPHNGTTEVQGQLYDAWLAYTFYVSNSYFATVDYSATFYIDRTTKGVGNAVRVLWIEDSTYFNDPSENNKRVRTIYAAPDKNGNLEQGDTGAGKADESFANMKSTPPVAFEKNKKGLDYGFIHKYTVVIYLEGDDPECNNSIMGGSMKMSLDMKITGFVKR